MSSSWKDASRLIWSNNDLRDCELGTERLAVGCLQRIADSTEVMAKTYTDLIRERDNYKRWYQEERAHREGLQRQIGALRGFITKLKKKVAMCQEAA